MSDEGATQDNPVLERFPLVIEHRYSREREIEVRHPFGPSLGTEGPAGEPGLPDELGCSGPDPGTPHPPQNVEANRVLQRGPSRFAAAAD